MLCIIFILHCPGFEIIVLSWLLILKRRLNSEATIGDSVTKSQMTDYGFDTTSVSIGSFATLLNVFQIRNTRQQTVKCLTLLNITWLDIKVCAVVTESACLYIVLSCVFVVWLCLRLRYVTFLVDSHISNWLRTSLCQANTFNDELCIQQIFRI